ALPLAALSRALRGPSASQSATRDRSAESFMSFGWSDRFWAWALLAPSRHPIACAKREIIVPAPHGGVQLWGEAAPGNGEAPDLVILRLLGARGRAELATRDPGDRLPDIASVTWTLNPPRFGASGGALSI